jgi:hypothetical protein
MGDRLDDDAREFLRMLFCRPTRRERLQAWLRRHLRRRPKPFTFKPGDTIRLLDDTSERTITSVSTPTTITVTRFGRGVRRD